jgi:hypothetical protein
MGTHIYIYIGLHIYILYYAMGHKYVGHIDDATVLILTHNQPGLAPLEARIPSSYN